MLTVAFPRSLVPTNLCLSEGIPRIKLKSVAIMEIGTPFTTEVSLPFFDTVLE